MKASAAFLCSSEPKTIAKEPLAMATCATTFLGHCICSYPILPPAATTNPLTHTNRCAADTPLRWNFAASCEFEGTRGRGSQVQVPWTLCRASDSGGSDGVGGVSASSAAPEGGEEGSGRDEERDSERGRGRRGGESRVADSTDWVSSNLTRRFGLGAGLAWVGVLAFGVISEQIKTRTEVFREEQGTRDVEGSTEVTLPNGIRYTELRQGGGSSPQRGDLVLIDITGKVSSTGEVFVDTTEKGNRSVAFVFGAKPYSGGMCDGLEYVLRTMKVGGQRRVIVPPALGYGESGATLNSGAQIPGNATLEYVVQLQRSSIAPS